MHFFEISPPITFLMTPLFYRNLTKRSTLKKSKKQYLQLFRSFCYDPPHSQKNSPKASTLLLIRPLSSIILSTTDQHSLKSKIMLHQHDDLMFSFRPMRFSAPQKNDVI